jgi:CheY-like chemotaxis protein
MSLKIMVADDEQVSLKAIRSLSVSSGHTVLTFEDPQQAGERAEQQRFDVVFLGMRPQDLTGLDLARRIRNSESNAETTIVMLNATEDIESLRNAFGEGADFVLTKPVSSARLLPMLAALSSPNWNGKRHAARMPLFTEVICKQGGREFKLRSMNISSTGMLFQPATDLEIGAEVSLDFAIAEVRASLSVSARVVRKEGNDRVAMAFVGLAPEASNAIQLYVMGRLSKVQQSNDRAGSRSIWMGHGFLSEP